MKEQLVGTSAPQPDYPTLLQGISFLSSISDDLESNNASLCEIANRIGAYSHKYDPTPVSNEQPVRPRTADDDTALVIMGRLITRINNQLSDYRQEVGRLNILIGQR